jgi:LysR family transcriptional regulator for bpeEF and oprC
VRLLRRTTRSLSLTEDGRRYLAKMEVVSASVRELERHVGDDGPIDDHIWLTAPPLLVERYLVGALDAFLLQHPRVCVTANLVNREVNLIEEGYDIALRVGHLADTNLVARPVGTFPMAVVASPGYLARHTAPRHPRDLADHPCMINTLTPEPRRWLFRDGQRHFSVKIDGRCTANDDRLLVSYACAGLGIAGLPAYVVRDAIRAGRLVPLLEAYLPEPFTISVVYPDRRLLSRAKRLLIDHLVAHAERAHAAYLESVFRGRTNATS